jgi:hypothetical protein
MAVVNCASKFAEHFADPAGNRRSCRVPYFVNHGSHQLTRGLRARLGQVSM